MRTRIETGTVEISEGLPLKQGLKKQGLKKKQESGEVQ